MFLLYKHVRLTCGFFNKLMMMMMCICINLRHYAFVWFQMLFTFPFQNEFSPSICLLHCYTLCEIYNELVKLVQ